MQPIFSRRSLLALILLGAGGLAVTADNAAAGGLVEAGELEHARANARAGGPVSERDAELLERYGCLSGTNSPVCRQGYRGQRYYYADRRHKHRTHKHRRRHR
ncbi:YARHG domain-containing protein [Hyphomicrobium sp. 1Nfss2.1]